jgi:hypothetical protein
MRESVVVSDPIAGLSKGPTPHVFWREGERYYVCCGVDLLLNSTSGAVSGQTSCPICEREIRVRLAGNRIESLDPPGTFAVVQETLTPDGERCVVCSGSALFDSPECLGVWRLDHPAPSARVHSVQQFLLRCSGPGYRTGRGTPDMDP